MRAVRAAVRRRLDSRRLFSVVVLGLLVGLVGMYAFCMQGSCAAGEPGCPDETASAALHARMDMTPVAAAAASAPAASSGLGAHLSANPAAAVSPETTVASQGGHSGHDSGAMLAMMCLAVLAVALALLLPTLARNYGFLRLPRLSLSRVLPTRHYGVGAGPPVVWEFSVIRC